MALFAVIYTYRQDSGAARDATRPEHIDFLREHFESGNLLASGRLGAEGPAGALLVWQAGSADALVPLLDGDPFMRDGLIADRQVREWEVVFGGDRLK